MFEAPFPPYDPTDKTSYVTVLKRWPVILTQIIDTIYHADHDLGISLASIESAAEKSKVEEKIEEGKAIISKISQVKYEMARNRPLEPIPADGEAMVEMYNEELARLAAKERNTWFTAPWLYAECYLYRLIRSFFVQSTHWRTFDPFATQKETTFKSSGKAIYQLARTMHELEVDKSEFDKDPAKLGVLFGEMIQMCLWGNATDLSMLTHLSHDDIAHLQTVGRDAQAERRKFILKDDQDQVWQHIQSLEGKDARIDFVLDNSGFEVLSDPHYALTQLLIAVSAIHRLHFADFLVTFTPYASKVVFHPKLIPWFVSDVTPTDFTNSITSLLSDAFFPPPSASIPSEAAAPGTEPSTSIAVEPPSRPEEHEYLRRMVSRWKSYIDHGVFALSVPSDTPLGGSNPKADFWTSPWPYWDMKERTPEIFKNLSKSGLVILKGDLNIVGLKASASPLAGAFPILSLRTNKADVAVAVDQAVADALDKQGVQWRTDGKYALVLFAPKSA
ncbi:hypothetical protein NLI96_g3894 [Meripilus lineatus]|uniref:Sugar phosphate phosphatase n=1 Tax=Meripilus lineatus TaxID=2056292 RepID=A0AAD5VAV2_9APHY|nr:hypothetical protein NLI96_g3894 [Physisporinus lineatus]